MAGVQRAAPSGEKKPSPRKTGRRLVKASAVPPGIAAQSGLSTRTGICTSGCRRTNAICAPALSGGTRRGLRAPKGVSACLSGAIPTERLPSGLAPYSGSLCGFCSGRSPSPSLYHSALYYISHFPIRKPLPQTFTKFCPSGLLQPHRPSKIHPTHKAASEQSCFSP